ncbi:MAG: undecaprenyldiphospho-muramoylpentapeptide beta-N-acetylglucosaminyltransferase [Bacteroidales bacterium]|nr:undecaprenyldiphospho-muramoylpentapeptide beta-N-acetylglucosaminyltransferase [Bacteroidales bacterium]
MHKSHAKILISGGGTGGHIYPAIAIADALKARLEQAEILFIGAEGKMEMEKVPKAGYKIEGLPIRGYQRGSILSNLNLPFRLLASMHKAGRIIKNFKPDVVVGVGGYASAPTVRKASKRGIPTLIQEQNSYAGLTNRCFLGKRADKYCVAYAGMEKFFPKDRIILTGNPIRKDISNISQKHDEALQYFNLRSDRKTLLVFGGSQGALGINEGIYQSIDSLLQNNVQLIWQTGKYYYPIARAAVNAGMEKHGIRVLEFIDRMDLAYAIANVIVSRAGAIAISEISAAGKPCIFVPLPTAAEDHQTKNASALAEKNAAILIKNNETREKLGNTALELLFDEKKQNEMSKNILEFAHPDAANKIADEIIKLMRS